ncbi:MAG: sugar phosphate isomerase/epimerase [Clostridiales bacterium]|jgi:sugar phosphate isomerase/epimerase|nr:sugar phosphate isomerase/epimerase [Clostridiales bacterium]
MKIGVSIYSLFQAIMSGELTPLGALEAISGYGADNIELVNFVTPIDTNEELLKEIKDKCANLGLAISAYSVGSDVLDKEGGEREAELARIFRQIDIAEKVGAPIIRSDLTKWGRPPEINMPEQFDKDLPILVGICRKLADYAAPKGITVTVENHGTYINNSERIRRLICAVDRPNYRVTLDVGNCLCVDEDPWVSLKNLLPYAATIHFKDFLVRKNGLANGAGGPATFSVASWLTTNYGNFLRGTIVGDGDIDTPRIVNEIVGSGYDGALAIEFEGPEECKLATQKSLANLKRMAGRE